MKRFLSFFTLFFQRVFAVVGSEHYSMCFVVMNWSEDKSSSRWREKSEIRVMLNSTFWEIPRRFSKKAENKISSSTNRSQQLTFEMSSLICPAAKSMLRDVHVRRKSFIPLPFHKQIATESSRLSPWHWIRLCNSPETCWTFFYR